MDIPPAWVSLHTCHRCGYTDDRGDGFTDSGNDDSDDFRELPRWEKELLRLEDEVEELKYRIKKAKERWEKCWESGEDVY